MDSDTILFGPDRNLSYYVRKKTGKTIIPVPEDGHCPTHERITLEDLKSIKDSYPDAPVIVHPECLPEVQDFADEVASTSGILKIARANPAKEFIIGTEKDLTYRMQKENPGKIFHHTLGNNPENAVTWCRIAKEEARRVAR